ncbi:SixA phosphatase family protein [Aquirufa sp.]|jgi:phosphohistidine phosphatase|uniref:SixA phosphatase family protein n=1 Tax=Aquirufa sp. TaxID=2676249 RepID=UPI0037BEC6DC
MIELILIRHAHAGPYTSPDEARKLSSQGIEEANELAQKINNAAMPQGIWLVSDAVRTRETFEVLSDEKGVFSDFWYHATGPQYVQELVKQESPVIYLVAHNPSISYVASYFLGETRNMETANCVHLQWPNLHAWAEVTQDSATLKFDA